VNKAILEDGCCKFSNHDCTNPTLLSNGIFSEFALDEKFINGSTDSLGLMRGDLEISVVEDQCVD
jgi:hypothetical protein